MVGEWRGERGGRGELWVHARRQRLFRRSRARLLKQRDRVDRGVGALPRPASRRLRRRARACMYRSGAD